MQKGGGGVEGWQLATAPCAPAWDMQYTILYGTADAKVATTDCLSFQHNKASIGAS